MRRGSYLFLVMLSGLFGYPVEATLNDRSAPQGLLNDLLGEQTVTLPVLEMTSAPAKVTF